MWVTKYLIILFSEVVMMLISLINPLEYIGDVRPYLTIHEKDFTEYIEEEDLIKTNSPIVGTVNPFCLRVRLNQLTN